MKILIYDMVSFTIHDIIYYLEKAGHSCKLIYYKFPNKFKDDFFCERFVKYIREDTYDFVFSVNFFPLVAQICYEQRIRYVSWTYDSPLDMRLQNYFSYDTNYIFLFDRIETERYRAQGYEQVYHQPLASNTARFDALTFSPAQRAQYSADVSFIGRLYASPLDTLISASDPYTKGYIEGIIQAQLRVYGYYLIDDLITDELLNIVNTSLQKYNHTTSVLNMTGLSFAIASQVTNMERTFLLEQMGELFDTKLYTTDPWTFNSPVKLCGTAKYYTAMPGIFRFSKLNLNPTLRSIQSGIPLRALDIMGAKGVLFSNYQPELAEHFENDKDVIMYSSMEEAFDKASFYLHHKELLPEIANNGYQKVKEHFNYPLYLKQIFNTCQLQ